MGSLIAALASFLNAKSQGGKWLLRIEDVDPPRERPGAADDILQAVERFGLEWDGSVMYQSHRDEAYLQAIRKLQNNAQTYYCQCSRKTISAVNIHSKNQNRYPGTCRNKNLGPENTCIRVQTPNHLIKFVDLHMGVIAHNLEQNIGDFIVRRRDGLFAYHLALVVDDAAQGVTEVVRGGDLLECTTPQIHLQKLLGLPTPAYFHTPVVVDANGQKLSKHNYAKAVGSELIGEKLCLALTLLGQNPAESLKKAPVREIVRWAIETWNPSLIPKESEITYLF